MFKILALAPFGFSDKAVPGAVPIPPDPAELDQVMASFGLNTYVSLPQELCPQGGMDVSCSRIKDFHPDAMVKNLPFLQHLLEAKRYLDRSQLSGMSAAEIRNGLDQWPDLPQIAVNQDPKRSSRTSRAIDNILDMVALPDETVTSVMQKDGSKDLPGIILQKTLDAVFQHQPFKTSEASWRGLHRLLKAARSDQKIHVSIAHISLENLQETLQDLLPDMVKDLPALILVDLPLDNTTRNQTLLKAIAEFAATLMTPTLVWLSPAFFNLHAWEELSKRPFLPHFLEEAPYAKWRSLKQDDNSDWLAVTCNRFLLRYPYGPQNMPRLFPYEESHLPWVAPVWGVADLIMQGLQKNGWPTRFTDKERFRVEDLALHTDAHGQRATETIFSDDRADQLFRSGITPLMGMVGKDIAYVSGETTLGGISLGHQLYLSWVIRFLLSLQEKGGINFEDRQLEAWIQDALKRFLGDSLEPAADAVGVSVGRPDANHRVPITLKIIPSQAVLTTRQVMELTLSWDLAS